ncbi:TlpA family protein disulfide reductase [Fredinandcohnia humi]
MKKIIVLLIFVGLVGFAVWQYVEDQKRGVTGIEIGNTAPDFELSLLSEDRETVSLSELKGKKIILNFWASWCHPCTEEMPEFQEFYETKNGDIEVFAINMTATEVKAENVQKFLDGKGFTFPILLDEENLASSDYGILTVPTTFFINSDGTISDRKIGQMDLEMIQNYVNRMK